ncbi:DUF4327 family protein [Waterburya agarophytonicola K14]|uniref:DUF4327 family protein n=1 Tax=Waterburya agarophytonicola KI4 TaxID=2874699 RepID=A0A964BUG5_9CYAN|nr:DUF4327 family protein [Waterburya agarophytonicola]MCC0179730.1 DUF4327 family protein [Waterburya agarophytonicola KI4]
MFTILAISIPIKRYSLNIIKEEAYNLLEIGTITLDQPLRILCDYLPVQRRNEIECELESYDYLLRDRVRDLIGKVAWESD